LSTSLHLYDYHLPKELIAERPVKGRVNSRLLVYNRETMKVEHRHFFELPEILPPEYSLVLNESKVFPCRLTGTKESGGKCEIFILSLVPLERSGSQKIYSCLIKSRGKKKVGDLFVFDGDLKGKISALGEDGDFEMEFIDLSFDSLQNYLNQYAQTPIPPYIRQGVADEQDLVDYQTVFAKNAGSVAAPTAGLHFTDEMFERLKKQGRAIDKITLHVGMGTFRPVSSENILDHKMHTEEYSYTQDAIDSIKNHKKRLVVGTTSLRALESSFDFESQSFKEAETVHKTNLFLYPGKPVYAANALLTNFHLPKSSLLILVSSLVGREVALELYELAINEKYRFFSYGDAMLIL
jgi:S-adenosylmethionine:tRNA ribosyltransferase-isomerase